MENYLLHGIESERLYFQKLVEEDFNLWLPFYKSKASQGPWSGNQELSPELACRNWFNKVFYRYKNHLGGMNALRIKTTQAFIGQCGLLWQEVDHQRELEIGYSLLPAYRSYGYATEAASKCKEIAFESNFATSLISIIHIDNIQSQNVAKKNGMHLEKTTTYKDNPVHIFRVFRP